MTVGTLLFGIACFWAGYLYRWCHERPAVFLVVYAFEPDGTDESTESWARDFHPERN